MQNKKNIIFTIILCAQGQYIVAGPAEVLAQTMKESAIIQAEALKEVAPKVGLESAEILSSALLEAAPHAGSEAAQILASAFKQGSNEATSKSSGSFIESAQTTIAIIKGVIALAGISACLYVSWPRISRYFSLK